MQPIKKLLIVGHGRHGKDEAAMHLSKITPLRYAGSCSWAVLPLMAEYLNIHPQQAWETRHQMRELWKSHCDELRRFNPARLMARALQSGDIVTGCRQLVELEAAKSQKIVDYILWIERPGTPTDPTVDFGPEHADEILTNDGSLTHFHEKLRLWAVLRRIAR